MKAFKIKSSDPEPREAKRDRYGKVVSRFWVFGLPREEATFHLSEILSKCKVRFSRRQNIVALSVDFGTREEEGRNM